MKARFEIDLAGVTTIESARSPKSQKGFVPYRPLRGRSWSLPRRYTLKS